MILPILFIYAAGTRSQAAPPTAAGLISKMFLRYNSAKTLGGTVRTSQIAGSAIVVTDTNLAYQRPSKLYLAQRQKVGETIREKLLVSDGTVFHYTPPEQIVTSTPFLAERVQPPARDAQTVGDLYLVLAANLPDRSPVLDALVGRSEDLQYFKNQLATFHLAGKETIGGRVANVIEGNWRETEVLRVGGTFKMYLGDEGDLIRYVLVQSFSAPASTSKNGHPVPSGDPISVTTTWDVSVIVNAPLKPDTFAFRGS